ncbi:hypothetical protein FQR65_LT04517 [Abscondita terminalis]|nr:hypothetical protein FQR65_LT04517 [Abscondita terminalis]
MTTTKKLMSENDYFSIFKKLFNLIGIYLYESNNLNARLCMTFHVVTFGLCVYLFIITWTGSYELVETMYTMGFLTVELTCVSIIIKRKHLMKVFEILENGIFLTDSGIDGIKEKHLINAWVAYSNKLCLLVSPTVGILTTCSYLVWIFTKYLQLPFGIFVKIINVDLTAFIQFVWFGLTCSGYLFTDLLFFIVLSHIKLHLTNLQTYIKKLLENSDNDCLMNTDTNGTNEDHIIKWKYLQKRLKQAVSYHSEILDVSKLIDEAFHLCSLVKFLALSYCLCLIIYNMSQVSIKDGIFWILFLYTMALIVPTNIIYYYGNDIILQSENIADCCYNIEFVGTNIRFQKALLIMIQRSQRPIVLTIGKFAPISIATSIAATLNMTVEEKLASEKNYFSICKKMFNLIGIYLYESNNLNARVCIIYHAVTLCLCVYLLKIILAGSYELVEIMYSTGFISVELIGFSIIIKRKHLMKVFETLENGIFLPDSDRGGIEEKHLINTWIAYLNKICLLVSPIVGILATCSYMAWKFTKYLQLPFGIFVNIINVDVTAFIQFIWFGVVSSGYLYTDLLFFIVLSHIKLHLTNLQACIKKLLQNSANDCLMDTDSNEKNGEHNVEWKYVQKRLKQVVCYHTAILDVSKLIDEAFHMCSLVKFFTISYCLCLLIYNMSQVSIKEEIFWILFFYSLALTVSTNIIYYYGNDIILESQNIADCCYNIEFVGTSIKLQKALLLMIQRSQRPIVITVGKFAPISIATSIAVIRATYSYFMVLYSRK